MKNNYVSHNSNTDYVWRKNADLQFVYYIDVGREGYFFIMQLGRFRLWMDNKQTTVTLAHWEQFVHSVYRVSYFTERKQYVLESHVFEYSLDGIGHEFEVAAKNLYGILKLSHGLQPWKLQL